MNNYTGMPHWYQTLSNPKFSQNCPTGPIRSSSRDVHGNEDINIYICPLSMSTFFFLTRLQVMDPFSFDQCDRVLCLLVQNSKEVHNLMKKKILVLLSASVERFGVSRMRDLKNTFELLNQFLDPSKLIVS